MITVLKKRIYSGLTIFVVLLLALFWAPAVSLGVVLATLATLAMMEFYQFLELMQIPAFRITGAVFGVILIAVTWVVTVFNLSREWETAVLAGIVMILLLRQLPQKYNGQPMATIACTLLGLLYVPFLCNYFTKLAFTWEPPGLLGRMGFTGQVLIFYLVSVVKVSDSGAFMIGSQIGRHKLIPRISPKKTWEGFLGGIGAGLAVSLLVFFSLQGQFGQITLRLHDAVILGILLPVLGTGGDLIESLLKRAAGTKDSSTVIPGMGGTLDVLDSLLMAAPALYFYVQWFLVRGP